MKLVIDVLGAPEQSGGMRLYAEELVNAMAECDGRDRFVIVGGPWITDSFAGLQGVDLYPVPRETTVRRIAGQFVITAWAYWRKRADYVLSVSPVVTPFVPRSARVCVIHDWRHLKSPWEFPWPQRIYRRLWKRSAQWSAYVIAISNKTRSETCANVPRVDPVVIENGRDHARRWKVDKRALEPRTIVTFGHQSNKRPEMVIDALAHLVSAGEELSLTVLGARGQYAHELRHRALSLGIEDRVTFPGFVEARAYQRIVASASVVVMASTDEGFGLPVAEAQYFGIPAVATSDSGLAEIHGGALAIAEPNSAGLADAISRVLTSPEAPHGRTGLRTWSDNAQDVLALLSKGMVE